MKSFKISLLLIIFLSATAFAQESTPAKVRKNSFGLGLGIPYGILGVNMDFCVAPGIDLSLGIGSTLVAGIGYNAGVKYFFQPPEKKFRPKISAFFGTNTAIEFIGGDKDNEAYNGLSIGVGGQWLFGKSRRNGIDFDIFYYATRGYDLDEIEEEGYSIDEPADIGIAIGYRRTF